MGTVVHEYVSGSPSGSLAVMESEAKLPASTDVGPVMALTTGA
jgi:hypothetical protein